MNKGLRGTWNKSGGRRSCVQAPLQSNYRAYSPDRGKLIKSGRQVLCPLLCCFYLLKRWGIRTSFTKSETSSFSLLLSLYPRKTVFVLWSKWHHITSSHIYRILVSPPLTTVAPLCLLFFLVPQRKKGKKKNVLERFFLAEDSNFLFVVNFPTNCVEKSKNYRV